MTKTSFRAEFNALCSSVSINEIIIIHKNSTTKRKNIFSLIKF